MFQRLPRDVQRQARAAYRRFMQNPRQRGLNFRQVHPVLPIYSARIGLHYRAVGRVDGNEVVWFWEGSHAAYDALLTHL